MPWQVLMVERTLFEQEGAAMEELSPPRQSRPSL
jgi:hypothetical protein